MPFCLVLLLIEAGFQSIPLTISGAQISQADAQKTRCEVIAKSALILEYRPAPEHIQAISDLQVILPRFQQEQAVLAAYHNETIQAYLLQAQPDYLAIVKATQNILARKDKPVDMDQVSIIMAHERGYTTTMNALLVYGLQRLDARTLQVFLFESGIDALLLIMAALFWIRVELIVKKQVVEEAVWQRQQT
jgi:hypothetical protein